MDMNLTNNTSNKTLSEQAIRTILANYGNEINDLEAGPHTARKIMAILADTPWSEPLTKANNAQTHWTGLNANAIIEILDAIQNDLIYGTQTETEVAHKLQIISNELRDYYILNHAGKPRCL